VSTTAKEAVASSAAGRASASTTAKEAIASNAVALASASTTASEASKAGRASSSTTANLAFASNACFLSVGDGSEMVAPGIMFFKKGRAFRQSSLTDSRDMAPEAWRWPGAPASSPVSLLHQDYTIFQYNLNNLANMTKACTFHH
jgi:hypothetical protein